MKSGQAPQNPFEKMRDMAEDIKDKAVERTGPAKPSAKSKKSSSEVVDVEATRLLKLKGDIVHLHRLGIDFESCRITIGVYG